ncbi:MAG: PKD domain-containing protein [Phycisphaerae bacterium]|nr:PKD domain-containing protein [Phycisphaerae bacterium]
MNTQKALQLTGCLCTVLLLCIGWVHGAEIIIDNGDTGTSSAGPWRQSEAPGAYGETSLYSRGGPSYTWTFEPPDTGRYELSMWWTEWPSRATRVKILVTSEDGTHKVYVNQRENGGKWNAVGMYNYTAGKTYDVKVVSAPGSASSCADAVKFVKFNPPAADFSADRYRGSAPYTVKFSNKTVGAANEWHWDFGDGQTSTEKNPSHTYTAPGVHTVALTATGAHGANTKIRYSYIDIKERATENIYVCDGYGGNAYLPSDIHDKMWDMGAVKTATGWTYSPANSNMTYHISILRDGQALVDALYEENAHVIIGGHANYGFGLVFASPKEIVDNRIDDYDCVDSERLLNYSTDWVAAKVDGMKYGQAYPNWKPVFRDGTSAAMPYNFGDPRGNPPYNYYLTYQLPGDPIHYRMEIDGKYVERFGDSGAAAWYSPEGLQPDPAIDRACFITNAGSHYNRFDFVGEWPIKKYTQEGHALEHSPMNYNFQTQWPGSGNKVAKWSTVLKRPGQYRVMVTYPPLPENATNARYVVRHAGGSSVVYLDQTKSSGINSLGVYNFNAGLATIELSDKADGYVVADSLIFRPVADAEHILCAEFDADVRSGASPMTVQFTNRSYFSSYDNSTEVAEWEWDFGDGTLSNEENPSHTYATGGAYKVTLRMTTADGREDLEEKRNFIVVDGKCRPTAQFRASAMKGMQTMTVKYHDQSSGDVDRWYWDFGDGETSRERNPVHTYRSPGRYSVRLRVYGPAGKDVEIERDYVHVFMGECYTDNTFRTRPHYNSGDTTIGKVICYAGPSSIDKTKLKYARMFHGSCNSIPYFGEVFSRGLMYGKIDDVSREHDTATNYLEYYLLGYCEQDILDHLNELEDVHAFYNFSEKPLSER